MNSRKILFFGKLPGKSDVGGVATFTYNIANIFKSSRFEVVDLYPASDKKIPHGLSVRFIKGNLLRRLFGFISLFFVHDGAFFFNFSTIRSCLLLFICPKKKGDFWISIFHNGEQREVFNSMNFIKRKIVLSALKRIDVLCYLSSSQYDFFKSVSLEPIYKVSPFIKFADKELRSKNLTLKSSGSKPANILITGYPTANYRILESLDAVEKLNFQGFVFNFTVCLYGDDCENLKSLIIQRAKEIPNVVLFESLNPNDFSILLKNTDIYIRLNEIDSFGLVVAEAIESGAFVIATSVCDRYPGAMLFDVDDYDALTNELATLISTYVPSGNLKVQQDNLDVINYHIVFEEIFRMLDS